MWQTQGPALGAAERCRFRVAFLGALCAIRTRGRRHVRGWASGAVDPLAAWRVCVLLGSHPRGHVLGKYSPPIANRFFGTMCHEPRKHTPCIAVTT